VFYSSAGVFFDKPIVVPYPKLPSTDIEKKVFLDNFFKSKNLAPIPWDEAPKQSPY